MSLKKLVSYFSNRVKFPSGIETVKFLEVVIKWNIELSDSWTIPK